MKKSLKLTFFSIMIIFFSKCTVYEYVPNSLNAPLFQEKNEVKGNLSLFNYQLGYSFTNHFAITANYFWNQKSRNGWWDRVSQKEGANVDIKNYTTHDFEVAGGYYLNKNSVCLEFFGGFGYGKILYDHSIAQRNPYPIDYNYILKANPLKLYLQTDFGYKLKPNLDIALSVKIMDYQYKNINNTITGYNDNIDKPYDLQLENRENNHLYFIQPAFTIRTGKENIKFQAQVGLSKCLNYRDLNTKNGYIRFSCYFNFPIKQKED